MTEGARILGQIYAEQGKYEKAYDLLQPYAEQRLQALHQAEQKFEEAFKAAQKRVVSSLETGKAPDFAFTLYHQADKTKQEEMVRTYVFGRLKDDPELQRQREVLARESVVVPVAIDLGIAQLRGLST